MQLINKISSVFLLSNLSTRFRMDGSLLYQYIINWVCAVSLFVYFSLCLVEVFFSFLFLGERGTSFGDKKLNMMNECLGLPIWPGRLVSVVKITAIAV